MSILADFPEINPNAIIVVVAVIFAAIKALIERGQKKNESTPPYDPELEELDDDLYAEYEAELERQRQQLKIRIPVPNATPPPLTTPPPLRGSIPKPVLPVLSKAEKKALENLNLTSRRRKKRSGEKSTKSRVYLHLSSPTAAREALVLAEVLGPPKALQGDK